MMKSTFAACLLALVTTVACDKTLEKDGCRFAPGANCAGTRDLSGVEHPDGADYHNIDFSGQIDLGKSKFRKANLKGANFKGNTAVGANFSGAILEDAEFDGATFKDCNFKGADFSDADLSGGTFDGCNFEGANLKKAFLRNADLRNSNFKGTNMKEASCPTVSECKIVLQGATCPDGKKAKKAKQGGYYMCRYEFGYEWEVEGKK